MNSHRLYRAGFAAIVGPANTGKSTLVNALVGKKVSIVSPKQQTTRNRILGVKTRKDGQLVLLDTPGFLRTGRRSALSQFMSDTLLFSGAEVDAAVLLVDAKKMLKDEQEAAEALSFVKKHKIPKLRIIGINKIDLIDKREILFLMDRLYSLFLPHAHEVLECVPFSALKKDGVELLEDCLLKAMPESPALFPEDAITDQPEEFFAAEIIREKLFHKLGQELPYSLAVRIERWEEEGDLIKLHAILYVERESQKGIVIGKGGSVLKSVGTSARRDLEKFFGAKVFLELFVKVERSWTQSERGLQKTGYRAVNSY